MRKAFHVAIFCLSSLRASAQGTFQNLNFEEADPGSHIGYLSTTSAIPYWSAQEEGNQLGLIGYDETPIGGAGAVSLEDYQRYPPIDGNYDVVLTGRLASISQVGIIPANCNSLFFDDKGDGTLDLFVGSQQVPVFSVGSGPNGSTIFQGSISAWAGQTKEITFETDGNSSTFMSLDDISFSPVMTPEPPIVVLGIIGGLFCGCGLRILRRGRTPIANS